MEIKKKVLIVENTFPEFQIYHEVLKDYNVFPQKSPQANQSWINDIQEYIFCEECDTLESKIKEQLEKAFGNDGPEFLILDLNLRGTQLPNKNGSLFKSAFLDKFFPNIIFFEISQYHWKFEKIKEKNKLKGFRIPKFENGNSYKGFKKTVSKYFNKYMK